VAALMVWAAIAGCNGETQGLMLTVTAYNSLPEQTQGDSTIGAWGDKLRPNDRVIAVSPDLIELGLDRGAMVEIDGLRVGSSRSANQLVSEVRVEPQSGQRPQEGSTSRRDCK